MAEIDLSPWDGPAASDASYCTVRPSGLMNWAVARYASYSWPETRVPSGGMTGRRSARPSSRCSLTSSSGVRAVPLGSSAPDTAANSACRARSLSACARTSGYCHTATGYTNRRW